MIFGRAMRKPRPNCTVWPNQCSIAYNKTISFSIKFNRHIVSHTVSARAQAPCTLHRPNDASVRHSFCVCVWPCVPFSLRRQAPTNIKLYTWDSSLCVWLNVGVAAAQSHAKAYVFSTRISFIIIIVIMSFEMYHAMRSKTVFFFLFVVFALFFSSPAHTLSFCVTISHSSQPRSYHSSRISSITLSHIIFFFFFERVDFFRCMRSVHCTVRCHGICFSSSL